jgi:PAS domain S-box-containing protein
MSFDSLKKTPWKTNLRMLLVLPFVCQVLAGLGVVSYLSYRNGQEAIEEMTIKLRKEIALRIENQVEQFIENSNRLNQINQDYIILNPSLLDDIEQLASYFARQYQWNKTVNSIAFASEKEGNYIEVIKEPSGDLSLTIIVQNKSNNALNYRINSQGKIIKSLPTTVRNSYDPRQESWYKNSLAKNDNYFYQIQSNSTNDQLIFINSSTVYDQQGRLLGVVNNHSKLTELSLFLSNLKIGENGIAFIIDKQGILIAKSLTNEHNNNQSLLKNKAIFSSDKYIQEISRYILDNLNNLQISSLEISKNKPLIEINRFTKVDNLEWLIILAIPESDFPEFIAQNNRVIISLLILALIMAISSGLITSKLIVQPVIKLQTASEKISQGDFNQKVPLQGIKELDALANSFNHMTDMLDHFFYDLNKSFQEVSNLKYAIEQSTIVTVTNPQGKIIYCNKKLTEISGYSRDELIGKKTNLLQSGCHSKSFYEEMWKQITGKHVWRGEIKNKAKDGSFYWVDTTIVPLIDEEGKIIQYLAIQSEITERKKLEKNLEKIVQIRTQELAKANEEITSLNKRLCSENIQMSGKLRMLHQMQQLILPTTEELKHIDGLDIAGYMEAADELGGDYYDVLTGDNTVTIGIGDVTGHGLESGILMVMTQAAICTLKQQGENDPLKFLDTLNRTIYYNIQRMNSEKNLSLAIINYFKGNVCITGQHEEVIVVRQNGDIELIDTIDLGLPIGIDEDIRAFIDHTIITLHPGDGIVLYTDGITEARDVDKNQYGIKRLCQMISQNWHLDSEEIRDLIINDVKKFIGLQKIEDDLTLLLLKQK